jgi:hypothetical protein
VAISAKAQLPLMTISRRGAIAGMNATGGLTVQVYYGTNTPNDGNGDVEHA